MFFGHITMMFRCSINYILLSIGLYKVVPPKL